MIGPSSTCHIDHAGGETETARKSPTRRLISSQQQSSSKKRSQSAALAKNDDKSIESTKGSPDTHIIDDDN
jgi:hypothetical protein